MATARLLLGVHADGGGRCYRPLTIRTVDCRDRNISGNRRRRLLRLRQLLVYDDNDQFVVDGSNATLAAFEEAARQGGLRQLPTRSEWKQYNPTDSSVVARFTVTQVNA